MALTISLTFDVSEPVHWYEQPSSLHASSAPYLVGTKNGFVVTWLTRTNFSLPSLPKTLPPSSAAAAVAVALESLPLEPHAPSIAAARPAAPPVSAVRRVTARHRVTGVSSCLPSAHSRRSSASLTGSSSDMSPPPAFDRRDVSAHIRASSSRCDNA